ncbi:MAG TPA: CHAT domain-containing protein [Blastocatellia bacterium]|nr:CHAT domain-containing protein [Blastocatellia bacterium]
MLKALLTFSLVCNAQATSLLPTQSEPVLQLQTQTTGDAAARADRLIKECRELSAKREFEELGKKAQEALEASRVTGDKARIARSYTYIAVAHFHSGRIDEALEPFTQAADFAGQAGNYDLQALCLNSAGALLKSSGRYEETLYFYNRVLQLHRQRGNRREEAFVLGNIGELYYEIGDNETSDQILQNALATARALGDAALQSGTLSRLMVLETHRGRLDLALKYGEEALALQPADSVTPARLGVITSLGTIFTESGNPRKASESFVTAAELARRMKNRYAEAACIANLGMAQYELGLRSEALASLSQAISVFRQLGDLPEDELNALADVARIQRIEKHDQEALATYRQAMKLVERLRSQTIPTETSRASILSRRRDLFVGAVDLLMELNRPEEALDVAETCHARAFLDLLGESRVDIRGDMTPGQRAREDSLFDRISAIQKELYKQGLTGEHEQELKADLSKAENDLEAFRIELHRENPRYAAVRHPIPASVDRLRREIEDENTTVIEYLLGNEKSYVWAVTRKNLAAAVLPPKRVIEERAASYSRVLTRRVSALTLVQSQAEFQHESVKLYEMLVKPVEASLAAARRVVIVPDGVLSYLPFETLSRSMPETDSLLARFAVTYAPSASALIAIDQPESMPAVSQKRLIAFGDPAYSGTKSSSDPSSRSTDPASATSGLRGERGIDFTSLPYSRAEVTGISSIYPAAQSRVFLGQDASEETVKAEKLDQYKYVHFAAHGVINEQRPTRSGIALSTVNDTKEDGILRMNEIMRLRLNADLVTLSACGTGLGKLIEGEGIIGLTRAFLYAGSRSVVVSLWSVNDAATAELMKSFYQNLARGLSKDEALRQAKLALVKGRQRTWRHPYFWAPFVLTGSR